MATARRKVYPQQECNYGSVPDGSIYELILKENDSINPR
jgi:hypothetical protein